MQKNGSFMGQQYISLEKRSPKTRKKLDKQKRAMVAFSPVARKLKNENTAIVKTLVPGRIASV